MTEKITYFSQPNLAKLRNLALSILTIFFTTNGSTAGLKQENSFVDTLPKVFEQTTAKTPGEFLRQRHQLNLKSPKQGLPLHRLKTEELFKKSDAVYKKHLAEGKNPGVAAQKAYTEAFGINSVVPEIYTNNSSNAKTASDLWKESWKPTLKETEVKHKDHKHTEHKTFDMYSTIPLISLSQEQIGQREFFLLKSFFSYYHNTAKIDIHVSGSDINFYIEQNDVKTPLPSPLNNIRNPQLASQLSKKFLNKNDHQDVIIQLGENIFKAKMTVSP